MDWKNYWNEISKSHKNLKEQVQRNSDDTISETSNHIIQVLAIKKTDSVLDLCCGNGLITNEIQSKCHTIYGIDQSEYLIQIANKEFEHKNTQFLNFSALDFSNKIDLKFDKIYLEFSFQYFDKINEAEQVINEMLQVLNPNGQIFIGDIPEKGKEAQLYNTIKKKLYRFSGKIKGTDTMGKFWKASEIDTICKKLLVNGRKLEQPNNLPYSHYRFDYLISK